MINKKTRSEYCDNYIAIEHQKIESQTKNKG